MNNMYNISGLNYFPSTNREWFAHAVFGSDLIEQGKILPLQNVKESTELNLFKLVNKILQRDSRNCAWTPDQIIKLTNKTLQTITYKINLEQCIDELEPTNLLWMLTAGAKNDALPTELEALTMERVASQIANEVEHLIFSGNSENIDEFDGVEQTLLKSLDSIKIKGIELNPENIISEIQKLYLAIPKAVRKQGKKDGTLCIYTSFEVLDYLKIALGEIRNGNVVVYPNFSIEDNVIKYFGAEIVSVTGIDDSTMIAANWTNLILGTDLLSDLSYVRLDKFPAPNDSKIFIDGRLRLGFAMPFEEEAVIYSSKVEDSTPDTQSLASEPTASEIVKAIKALDKVADVQAILDAELSGKNRSTVIEAAQNKINELTK